METTEINDLIKRSGFHENDITSILFTKSLINIADKSNNYIDKALGIMRLILNTEIIIDKCMIHWGKYEWRNLFNNIANNSSLDLKEANNYLEIALDIFNLIYNQTVLDNIRLKTNITEVTEEYKEVTRYINRFKYAQPLYKFLLNEVKDLQLDVYDAFILVLFRSGVCGCNNKELLNIEVNDIANGEILFKNDNQEIFKRLKLEKEALEICNIAVAKSKRYTRTLLFDESTRMKLQTKINLHNIFYRELGKFDKDLTISDIYKFGILEILGDRLLNEVNQKDTQLVLKLLQPENSFIETVNIPFKCEKIINGLDIDNVFNIVNNRVNTVEFSIDRCDKINKANF